MPSPSTAPLIDPAGPGTSEQRWRAAIEALVPGRVAAGTLGAPGRAVVVSPHPDDEVLGAGGLIRHLVRDRWEVVVVALSDGEAAYGRPDPELARRRADEETLALDRLCADLPFPEARSPVVERLGLPDGALAVHADRMEAALDRSLDGASLCVAPWAGDGHPDHEAAGGAAERAAERAGVPLWRFPVWLWHWGSPEIDLPWADCRRLHLDGRDREAKRRAIEAFASQLATPSTDGGAGAILTPSVLAHFQRDSEVFVL